MTNQQMHLGLIMTGAGGPGLAKLWLDPDLPRDSSIDIDWYVEYAQLAEHALFDLVFIVDSQFISLNSPPHYLNRLEPFTLLSALAMVTSRIGLVGTATTSYNDPLNLARRFASLDLISHGRAGWNVVTTGDAGTASNFGRDEHFDHESRYARGHEAVEVVQGLWDSYEDDAFPQDRKTGEFFDPSRVHALDHVGAHFRVAGPLNVQRSAQGQPVIFQSGDSDEGRAFGASSGEGIFTFVGSLPEAIAFRSDLRVRAERLGRDPDSLRVMPGIRTFVGDTDDEARDAEARSQRENDDFDRAVRELGRPFGWHDFTQYDPDAPFPDVAQLADQNYKTTGGKIVELARSEGLTLRETVARLSAPKPGPFVGSAETVADRLEEWFVSGGADGFNLHVDHPAQFRRFVSDVVPILQRRGLFRTAYESSTLRGNLGLAIPENRYTAARRAAIPEVAG